MTHSHGHPHGDPHSAHRTPAHIRKRLGAIVVPVVLATMVGLFLLWPSGQDPVPVPEVGQVEQARAEVTEVDHGGCEAPSQGVELECSVVTARVIEGEGRGDEATFNHSTGPTTRSMEVGDRIIVASPVDPPEGGPSYFFVDYDRRVPLLALGVLFALVVLALSRTHGFFALIGVGFSLAVLTLFVLPAILEGTNPVAVAVVGAAAIMFANLYLAHGVNARTTTAILGTMASLALTFALALLFLEFGRFTGFGSEEAAFLQISADRINLEGLLLGGIVIGTLGVLDDVTITQASAVWELHAANPAYRFRDLYRAAIRIGRDHIASTVNTLVLAYAGASLPLLILFTVAQRPMGEVLNSEVVAEEIVRTLVGSIGLVASVPVTTALAARVVTGGHRGDRSKPEKRSRHEREWREANDTTEEEFWGTLDDDKGRPQGGG